MPTAEYNLCLLPLGDTVRPENAFSVELRALELHTSSDCFMQKRRLLNLKCALVISQLLWDRYNLSHFKASEYRVINY